MHTIFRFLFKNKDLTMNLYKYSQFLPSTLATFKPSMRLVIIQPGIQTHVHLVFFKDELPGLLINKCGFTGSSPDIINNDLWDGVPNLWTLCWLKSDNYCLKYKVEGFRTFPKLALVVSSRDLLRVILLYE